MIVTMLQTILLVVMIVISVALAAVILLQRSEGGALGMGGGPSGFMTARGAGNLLTVTTWWLSGAFFACAIGLTIIGNLTRASESVVDSKAVGELAAPPSTAPQTAPAAQPGAPARTQPSLDDLESSLSAPATPAPAQPAQPAPAQ